MAVAAKTWTAAYGRYVRLRITAQEVEVDTPNNRSKVRVTGQVYYDGGTTAHNAYPQTYTVTVNGVQAGRQTGFTYSLSSGGTKNLTTYTSGWINHNSNGAKSVTVRGHITDGAGDTGTINQTYALTTIARASTLSSFSMPNHLKPGTTTTFNLGISRKSSSFTHDIQLRDGSTVIASWTGQGTPTTRSLTATQTNTLLRRMSSSTSRTMTLRVQTKSGSTNIGGALTRTATVRVHSDVKPTVEKLSVTIEGNAHAKNNVKRFVQNISRVSGKFTRTATGGASISSSRLQIRRVSGGADLQTINSNSGTFPRVVSLNGPYQARGIATDSRGRSNDTGWVNLSNFDVLAYATPQITDFSTERQSSTATTVNIRRYGKHSSLSGKNVLTIKLQKRASGTSTWSNVVGDTTVTSNTFGTVVQSTGHSVAASYDFRLYIVDQFGNSAEQISTVSTQRVVLDIHKNEGVGIGKIHEEGVLDVDGSAYFKGDVEFIGGLISNAPAVSASVSMENYPKGISMFGSPSSDTNGFPEGYHTVLNAYHSQYRSGQIVFGNGGRKMYFRGHRYDTGWSDFTEVAGVESGTNSNGEWVRFSDGTQICTKKVRVSQNIGSSSTALSTALPMNFPTYDGVYAGFTANNSATTHANISKLGNVVATVTATQWQLRSTAADTTLSQDIVFFAIGRWK